MPELPIEVPLLPDVPPVLPALPTTVLFEPLVPPLLPGVIEPEPLPDMPLPAVPELPRVDPLPEVPEAVEPPLMPLLPLLPMLPVVPESVPLPVVEPAAVVPGGQGVAELVLLDVWARAEPAASAEAVMRMLRLVCCNFMKTPGECGSGTRALPGAACAQTIDTASGGYEPLSGMRVGQAASRRISFG